MLSYLFFDLYSYKVEEIEIELKTIYLP